MKIIFFFLIFLSILCSYLNSEIITNLKVDIRNSYNSNVLKLSDHDIKRFEEDRDPEKFSITSSDDFITDLRLTYSVKHRYFFNHTQINRIGLKYSKYWNNEDLANYYLSASTTQYVNKKMNLALSYSYYPEIYSNRYHSILDREDIFRDFT